MDTHVVAVHRSSGHTFTKPTVHEVQLLAGVGVAGDAHAGETVRHRSRVRRDPTQPNLRQVHLVHAELHDELAARGFDVAPGAMGENVTTRGLDLLGLSRGTQLHLGPDAVVEITGLRNPCAQLDALVPGLMAAVLDRNEDGALVRKAGIMGVVVVTGVVTTGDRIAVIAPDGPFVALAPV
jgi:MOSC domain-containing protein YiiM